MVFCRDKEEGIGRKSYFCNGMQPGKEVPGNEKQVSEEQKISGRGCAERVEQSRNRLCPPVPVSGVSVGRMRRVSVKKRNTNVSSV